MIAFLIADKIDALIILNLDLDVPVEAILGTSVIQYLSNVFDTPEFRLHSSSLIDQWRIDHLSSRAL